jgi:hypothetical protein
MLVRWPVGDAQQSSVTATAGKRAVASKNMQL